MATIHLYKEDPRVAMTDLGDLTAEHGLESSSMHCQDDTTTPSFREDLEILSQPILVGYAFGPKKMSTMGVVMAEASKTNLSSVSTTVLVEEIDEEDEACEEDEVDTRKFALVCGNDERDPSTEDHHQHPLPLLSCGTEEERHVVGTGIASNGNSSNQRSSPRRKTQDTNNSNIMLSLDSYSGGLKNIVRYLHSSCSSVDTNSTTTTLLTTGTTVTGMTPSSASTSGKWGAGASICSGRSSTATAQQRLRVSFVPLDPDLPLEGQHGAKMDIILHKLTEDILCCSKF